VCVCVYLCGVHEQLTEKCHCRPGEVTDYRQWHIQTGTGDMQMLPYFLNPCCCLEYRPEA